MPDAREREYESMSKGGSGKQDKDSNRKLRGTRRGGADGGAGDVNGSIRLARIRPRVQWLVRGFWKETHAGELCMLGG